MKRDLIIAIMTLLILRSLILL